MGRVCAGSTTRKGLRFAAQVHYFHANSEFEIALEWEVGLTGCGVDVIN